MPYSLCDTCINGNDGLYCSWEHPSFPVVFTSCHNYKRSRYADEGALMKRKHVQKKQTQKEEVPHERWQVRSDSGDIIFYAFLPNKVETNPYG